MFAGQSYLWGPVMVLAVVGVLALVLRWIYGTARPVPPPRDDGDFGLLRELAIVRGQAEAVMIGSPLARAHEDVPVRPPRGRPPLAQNGSASSGTAIRSMSAPRPFICARKSG